MTLVFGCALRRVHSPGSGLGEIKGEPVRVEIGDKGFRIAAVSLQTDNTEGYFVEIRTVRL